MTPEQTLDWLAQQHFDQCCEERPIQDWIRKMKSQLPEQPEQEPVAWRFRSGTWFNREAHWRYINTLEGTEGLLGLEPLYTTPPQRSEAYKPLTEQFVMDSTRELSTDVRWPSTFIDVWRLCEAAHDIKE